MRSAPLPVPAIRTRRFELVSMSLAFMRALQAGDIAAASRDIGARTPAGLREDLASFLSFRIPDLERHPAWQPWLGRGIVSEGPDGTRRIIGTIGFHAPRDAGGRVEIGYRVEPGWRRRGVATECVAAILDWAQAQGVHRFRASVAPANTGSLAIVRALGFRQVGVRTDEIDGEELVLELDKQRA